MIGTKDEVVRHLRDLRQRDEGWTFLPIDEPRHGLLGFMAFRQQNDGEEEQRTYQWPVAGVPLEPDVRQVTSLQAIFEFIEQTGTANVVLCDDPVRRMIGVGRYEPENRRAVILEVPLTKMVEARGLTPEQRAAFMALRNDKLQQATQARNNLVGDLED